MNFRSDNEHGASPEILEALARANAGTSHAYGEDPLTARVESRLKEIFETDLVVFPVATGTSANSLALSVIAPPFGAIYCHSEAHIAVDECGGPEFYTGGAKLVGLAGEHGKLSAEDVEAALAGAHKGVVHHVQPAAISLTQATEAGTVYRAGEVDAIAAAARRHGLRLHMDGARFANALVSLGASPAEITWRAGVDILSFGASKNGALAAEAVVVFDRALAAELGFRRKRAGHLFSKMRFLSAQLDAYLADGLWLRNARHANAMARRLAEGLARIPGARLAHPAEANEVFVDLPEHAIRGLAADGFEFYRWLGENRTLLRLVTAFDTKESDVAAFIASAERHAARANERVA
ncbi:MAG TPA: low specificity L-threonine aldolase [Dongiaceae bacterium]|nr:low specificity L-threonine aldolase [Dongiaceae bacterium]